MVGDSRLDLRGEVLLDGIVSTGSLVLKTFGHDRAGELAAGRFLGNDRVMPETIFTDPRRRCVAASAGRRILVLQDTTEVNFSGRSAARTGLGPGGDGQTPGFFIHPQVAVDEAEGAVLGLLGARIWTRSGKVTKHRRSRPFEDKESHRWLAGAELAGESLGAADRVTVVCDREGDIYPFFARRPASTELVVRVAHDRKQSDELPKVFDVELDGLDTMTVDVTAQPGRKARQAQVSLRAGEVTLARPKNGGEKCDPESVRLWMVEVLEHAAPEDVRKPLHWRLYTTIPVTDSDGAHEIVSIYRKRWRIEEVFRALKSDGLKLEDSQVHDGAALMNLAALGMVAAVRILQLVDARDGTDRPATDALDQDCFEAVDHISCSLEGKTERQKNHHPPGSLSWLAWVCARLGGWNCYYKPPGPKTMANGWKRLAPMIEGYQIANQGKSV